jgi:D-threo-aldose 1-dehydrogenase
VTALGLPSVALGTAPLATAFWGNDEATGVATAAHAFARGITFFDTAPLYGMGEAETRLGRALAGERRGSFRVATKVGRLLVPDGGGEPAPVFDFSRDGVMQSLESSLERLGLDRVDVVHVHDPEQHLEQALGEAVPALAEMRAAGTIGAVSVGTNVVDTGLRFLGDADIDAMLVAGRLTLLDDSAGRELVPACAAAGVAYLAAGVFNSGVLARPRPGEWYDYAPAAPDVLERVRRMADVCAQHGTDLRTAAIQFVQSFPGVTTVVLGMASPAEVDDNLAALAAELPDELWAALAR